MMKKLYFISLLMLLTTVSVKAQVKFGIETGMNASQTVSGEYAEINGRVSGFQVGGTVDYQFGGHWTLMSGLSLIQKGGEINQDLFVRSADGSAFLLVAPPYDRISLKMNYIELPLKIGYKIRLNDRLSLIPSIGVYASYGFNAGSCALNAFRSNGTDGVFTSVKWKPFDGYNNPDYANSALDKLNHWDFGGIVGLKAVISDHYTASFNYSHSIKSIQKQMDLRNSTFQLSVGYRF